MVVFQSQMLTNKYRIGSPSAQFCHFFVLIYGNAITVLWGQKACKELIMLLMMIMFLRFMRSQKHLVSRYTQYLWKQVYVFLLQKKVKYSRENHIQVHYSLAQPQPQLMLQFVFSGVFLSITISLLKHIGRKWYICTYLDIDTHSAIISITQIRNQPQFYFIE